MKFDELYEKYKLLEEENKRLKAEIQQLSSKLIASKTEAYCVDIVTMPRTEILEQFDKSITKNSPSKEKIELFQSLFKGRADVCAKRWKNKPGYSPFCYNDFKTGGV